ncbi:MAG: tRNA epoxyqueuosine(34) reductase QueG [Candidatus Moranbacteria bacterium]|nr:tRNA epoxyqueuosine(34) reductase QueG [Candidatus Moranbacteria bacterium]
MKKDGLSEKDLALFVKSQVLAEGFSACGIAKASKLETIEPILKNWLDQGFNGSMEYMGRNTEKRLDASKLVPGAKSVIVAAFNYYPAVKQNPESNYRVSKYAYGTDYHYIIKEKLHIVASKIKSLVPDLEYRVFTDSAPVLEREWAVRSGLGWIGKNGCIILPQKGSFFFLGEIISNIDLEPDEPFNKNLCGKCNKCVEACPTGAIVEPGVIDARKCTSYLTIELKNEIPKYFRDKTNQWIFGCDTCQDVCPHNRFCIETSEAGLNAKGPVKDFDDAKWEGLDEETFNQFFKKKSAIARVGFQKLKDNILAVERSLK